MRFTISGVIPIMPDGLGPPSTIGIDTGRIMWIGPEPPGVEGWPHIPADGSYASPGFIDMHVHGGGGYDFMDGTVEAFLGASNTHARHGTTTMVPTTLAGTREELRQVFQSFGEAKNHADRSANLLGLHLEGPYVSRAQLGAQDPRFARDPAPEEYGEILSLSRDILIWTAAPELTGAMDFGRVLKERGILASIGHSDATVDQVREAMGKGFRHVAHLYSCMSTIKRAKGYRYPGVLESAYLFDGLTTEIIADGCHLPKELLQLAYKLKGPSRTALVTDAMRAAGSSFTESILGSLGQGQPVIIEDGVAKLPDGSAFAGSVATADRLVRTMVELAEVPLSDAVRMMTLTPAEILGIDGRKGSLTVGKDADIVLLDKGLKVDLVIVGGRVVH